MDGSPIRFLQELYPIDDIIARQLGMEHSQVKLVQGTPEQTDTYVFRALRRDGSVQMERRYTARLAQRPYMDIDPHGPQVHPSTGYLRVTVNGDLLLDETIPTDLERVWGRLPEYCSARCPLLDGADLRRSAYTGASALLCQAGDGALAF